MKAGKLLGYVKEPENISMGGDANYIGFNVRLTWESAGVYGTKYEIEQ